MKKKLRFILPLGLLVALIVTACEIPRPDQVGDIAEPPPGVGTPGPEITAPVTEEATEEATVAPPTEELPTEEPPTEEPPTEAAPTEEVAPADIEAEAVEALPEPIGVAPGSVIVKLSPQASIQARSAELGSDNIVVAGIGSLDQRLREIGATGLDPLLEEVADVVGEELDTLAAQAEEVDQLYVATFPSDLDPLEVAADLEEDPNVEYAEPNFIAGIAGDPKNVPPQLTPNDPYYSFQWHFPNIQMPAAWDRSTGQDVVVAIIDTGIDFGAPDLAGTNRREGYDFVNSDTDATDDNAHGTHVAGTVAQTTNNSLGTAGVAFNATLMPVKVLAADGNGTYENVIKGIIFAVNQGADIINMSLAGREGTRALLETAQFAHDRGVLVVAAAGNSNGPVSFPAAYDDYVLAVGAVRFDNTRANYSNFGLEIDLVAPGGDVGIDQNNDGYGDGVLQNTLSSTGSGYSYRFFEGTSMAAPHIAGVAALMLSRAPQLSPAQVEEIMMRTALNLGPVEQYGAGLVQASAALSDLPGAPVNTPTHTPTPTPSQTFTPTPSPTTPAPTSTPTHTPTPTPSQTFTPIPPPTNTPTHTPEPIDEHDGDIPTPTHTPTPTLTPTAVPGEPTDTPTPAPAGELLTSGGFETDEGWTFGDTPVRATYSDEVVLSGDRALKLGITSGPDRYSYTSAWQRVTIPPEARQVTLTAHIYPISKDIRGADVQNILILNERFRVIETLSRGLNDSQEWESVTFDLSHLKGRTVYIYFGVFNRGFSGRPTAMYVDDVSLTWSR